jgi:hypothetical protein
VVKPQLNDGAGIAVSAGGVVLPCGGVVQPAASRAKTAQTKTMKNSFFIAASPYGRKRRGDIYGISYITESETCQQPEDGKIPWYRFLLQRA